MLVQKIECGSNGQFESLGHVRFCRRDAGSTLLQCAAGISPAVWNRGFEKGPMTKTQ